jgi:glutamate N-acetyltransferase/amino-acid N-acetyltransferase
MTPRSLHVPLGVAFSAVAAGLKASGDLDLAYAELAPGTMAAALFTKNRVVAAPLQVGRAHLSRARGQVRALVVNSGNANCATGKEGLRSCEQVCRTVAALLKLPPSQISPSSTGIIGRPLPVEKVLRVLPQLLAAREDTPEAALRFARAIMTTDTRPKIASASFLHGKKRVTLLGIAKGAGMIHPQLATMLVYLFTDLAAKPSDLRHWLAEAADESFNSISVDGDTSTNDTVLLLATGQSGIRAASAAVRRQFATALKAICRSLAEQIVSDGEGARHLVRLVIEQARSRGEARQVARAIANSALVKTAWAGADPNWGRILAAAGASGVALDPARVNIFFGDQQVCRQGAAHPFDDDLAHAYLEKESYTIRVQLGRGRASVEFLTCDLTADYVRINAEYST